MDQNNNPFPPQPPQYPQQPPQYPPQPPVNPFMPGGGMGQSDLPNASAVLVLGIISIALCWCYGIIGLTCGIIALILGGKSMKLYNANPGGYSTKSFNNMKAGRICAIIGTILSALMLVYAVIYIVILGTAVSSMPWNY
jgi:M penetrans paralogue family 26